MRGRKRQIKTERSPYLTWHIEVDNNKLPALDCGGEGFIGQGWDVIGDGFRQFGSHMQEHVINFIRWNIANKMYSNLLMK